MSYWESVFLQSKVNRGAYDGDRLPTQNWDWPRETWFQKRLRHLRKAPPVLQSEDRTGLVITSQKYRKRKFQGRPQTPSRREISSRRDLLRESVGQNLVASHRNCLI